MKVLALWLKFVGDITRQLFLRDPYAPTDVFPGCGGTTVKSIKTPPEACSTQFVAVALLLNFLRTKRQRIDIRTGTTRGARINSSSPST